MTFIKNTAPVISKAHSPCHFRGSYRKSKCLITEHQSDSSLLVEEAVNEIKSQMIEYYIENDLS